MVQTNGANTVSVSANGTVPLATLPSGTTYTVTVSAQPTVLSQTCTVTGPGPNTLTANVTLPITCVTNHYNIIATVSGLAGTGLHLQVAPTAAVAATANATPYTLASVISGGAYTVTVPTQPTAPTQTCTPVPVSGNVTNADVPVAVTCTTFTSTVSGTISGLTGSSGLVLKDTVSGNTTATLAAGTTSFTISPAINSGASYNIVVLTQPTTPGQYCTIANASGTVVGTAITNVAVTCRNEGLYAFVADSVGGTVSSYTIDDTNGATAGNLTPVSVGVAADGLTPAPGPVAVAVNPAGTFVFTANSATADVSILSVAAGGAVTFVSSTSVGTPPAGVGLAGNTPSGVAVDPSGNYVLVTDSSNNVGLGIIVDLLSFVPSGPTLTLVNSYTAAGTDGAAASSVAVDPQDQYVFVSNQFNSPTIGLAGWALTTTSGGSLAPLTPATVGTGNGAFWVAVDPLDRFVYVSNSIDGSVSGWTIGTGGALTSIGAAVTAGFTAGAQSGNIAIDPSGQFLYVTDTNNNNVVGFTINQTTGALTAMTTGSPFSVDTGPVPVNVDPSGHFLYVGNTFGDSISMFTINTTTGVLTPIAGTGVVNPLPFSGSGPNAIAIK